MNEQLDADADAVDVVVAGAGAAGLAASLAAAQGGARVLLVEARENFRHSCNTSQTSTMIPAPLSRWQRAAGVEGDSPEVFRDDILRKTDGEAYGVLTERLPVIAGELMDWLVDTTDIEFELATDFSYPGHSRNRCHCTRDRRGATLHKALLHAAAAAPTLTMMVPAELVAVSFCDDGRVRGVTLSNPSGQQESIPAKAVVLACGGYAANADLVTRYFPDIAGAVYHGSDAHTGTSLSVAAACGADTGFLDAYQGYGIISTDTGWMVNWPTIMHGGIVVNEYGERFTNEASGYSELAAEVHRQPGEQGWVIINEEIADRCTTFPHFVELRDELRFDWHSEVADLAVRAGIDQDGLTQTVTTVRKLASACGVDEWGRDTWDVPLTGPLTAIRARGALFHSQGGPLVDAHARVLRNGQPIPGLYGAGAAVVGISGHGSAGYLAGNGLLCALGLGWLAGRHLTGEPVAT